MGSLIRTTAEAARGVDGEPAFEVVAQVGFDLAAVDDSPACRRSSPMCAAAAARS